MKPKIKSLALAMSAALFVALIGASSPGQQTYQAVSVRPAAVSGDLLDLANANDQRVDTRAYSSRNDYVGQSVTIDVGSLQPVIGVIQDHGRWPTHYPGAYKAEVAASPSGPWFRTFEGPGTRGTSKSVWPAIRARYIRITATAVNTTYNEDWTIAELKVGIDPGQTAREIPQAERQPDTSPKPAGSLRDIALASDGKIDTRATSGTPNYAGMAFTYDLGGEYELSRVVQVHGNWPEDYPGEYKVEVSRERNESRFREVWRGSGERGRSVARFNPVVTRYVRITALRNRDDQHWWSIAEFRTNRDEDVVEDDDLANRPIVAITSKGVANVNSLLNDNNTTRATTGTANYAGSWVQVDMGGNYTVTRVTQIHEPDRADFPGLYRVEVSEDGRRWRTVFEGAGERGRSSANFDAVRARFIRITAIRNRDLEHSWSIYRVKIKG